MKTERVQIRVTPEQKDQLRRLAEADNRTVSNYIMAVINDKLTENKK